MNKLQEEIIKRYKVKKEIDAKEEIRKTIDFIKSYIYKYPFIKSLVLGISGGVDSALLGKISQMTVEELRREDIDIEFIALKLPYGRQLDQEDVDKSLDFIKPDRIVDINIKDSVDDLVKEANKNKISIGDFNKGNVKARLRMLAQYMLAGQYNGIVLGTDHASENIMGFFTKYGDGSSDLMPLQRLNKRQVKKMLRELNYPIDLVEKVPTADLEDDKALEPDEIKLGVKYDEIDDYLEGKKIDDKSREIIERAYINQEHKRHMPINIFDDFWK